MFMYSCLLEQIDMEPEEDFPRGPRPKRFISDSSETSVKKKIKLTKEEPDLFKEV